ncbi:hypothetical protein MCGE09_00425 [Thaumarchaeota archaeon SCGC AB-539-E09]|nr:hypothetical protein MCGE09_00425 [Thaumarchaeota archaeon SCGC AB-539-E09]
MVPLGKYFTRLCVVSKLNQVIEIDITKKSSMMLLREYIEQRPKDKMLFKNIATIIDLDYTLVNVNTTFEFLRLVCPVKYAVFSKLFYPLLLLNRIFKRRDLYKKILIDLIIRGVPRGVLEQYARVYYNILNKNRNKYYNREVLSLLDNVHSQTILLSASLDIIVRNFKELGFDIVVGSQTNYKGEKFNSYSDLYNKKYMQLKVFLKYFDRIVIIDDSPEPEFYSMSNKIIVMKVA